MSEDNQKKPVNTARAVIVFLIAVSLTACSGPPSESDGRTALNQKIETESEGLIRLVSFKKTNGVTSEGGYQLEYTAEIEFLDDCIWSGGYKGTFLATRGRPASAMDREMLRYDAKEAAEKGKHQQVSNKLIFQRTENGWRLRS